MNKIDYLKFDFIFSFPCSLSAFLFGEWESVGDHVEQRLMLTNEISIITHSTLTHRYADCLITITEPMQWMEEGVYKPQENTSVTICLVVCVQFSEIERKLHVFSVLCHVTSLHSLSYFSFDSNSVSFISVLLIRETYWLQFVQCSKGNIHLILLQ